MTVGMKRAMPDNYEVDKRVRLDADGHFWRAFHEWSLPEVASALASGASSNIILSEGSTPLHIAANGDALNLAGLTPLHLALWRQLNPHSAQAHDAAIVATLIERNPNPHVSDYLGWTPLHLAAMVADIPTVTWLFSQNVKVDPTNLRGQTPLHVAARNSRQEGLSPLKKYNYERVIAGLLLGNASVAAKDGFNYTYEDYKQKDVTHIPTYSEEWYAFAIVVGINKLASTCGYQEM